MVDIVSEKPIRLTDLARHLGVSYKTVWAWGRRPGENRLRVTRLGNCLFTTWTELRRFQKEDEENVEVIPKSHRPDRQVQEQIKREGERLRAKHGI